MASLFVGHTVGSVVDSKKGGKALLVAGQLLLSATSIVRIFITSIGGAALSAVSAEIGFVTSRIPYAKGYYGFVGSQGSHTLAMLIWMELVHSFSALFAWTFLLVLLVFLEERNVLYAGLAMGAFGSLLVTRVRFKHL